MRHYFGIILIGLILGTSSVDAQQLNPVRNETPKASVTLLAEISNGVKAMENDIPLPEPQLKGKISLEETISQRRSKRRYQPQELTLEQISQLLWSAQGITDERRGFRSAPSAGALYPMEIYLLNKDGLLHYLPEEHKLERVSQNDLRAKLAAAAWGEGFIAQAPVDIVIAAVYERITSRYGARGSRYTDIEVGHIAQNIHLQAVALGLGSVPVGAFDDRAVKELLKLPKEEQPLYIIPVGYPKQENRLRR